MPEIESYPSGENLVSATRNAIKIRLVAIPSATILAAWSHLIPVRDSIYIFTILTVFTFLLYLTTVFKKGMLEVGYISATVEIAAASWFLWYANIQFYFFFAIFVFLILSHTILESMKKGFYVATIVVVAYLSLYFTNRLGMGEEITTLDITTVVVNVISIFGITVLTGRLSDQLKEVNKKLQISAEKIIENMSDGLIVLNEEGHIIRKNHAAEKILIAGDWVLESIKEGSSKIEISPDRIYESKVSPSNGERIIVLRDISPPCGMVIDKKNQRPLNLAVVRIYKTEFNRLQETKVTDETGMFHFMPAPGEYYLTAEKEGYKPYKSEMIRVEKELGSFNYNIKMEKT